MKYCKLFIVLSGKGSGVARIERLKSGLNIAVKVYAALSRATVAVIFKNKCYVRDLTGGELNFSVEDTDTSVVHVCVIENGTVALYGTNSRDKMWEANLLSIAHNSDGLAVADSTRNSPRLTGDRTYNDAQIPDKDFYTGLDLEVGLARVDSFLQGERITLSPNVEIAATGAQALPLGESVAPVIDYTNVVVKKKVTGEESAVEEKTVSANDKGTEKTVIDSAEVKSEENVIDSAEVRGEENVIDSAEVKGEKTVIDSAKVRGEENVIDSAEVKSEKTVIDSVEVRGEENVIDSAEIRGEENVIDSAEIKSEKILIDSAEIRGEKTVIDSAEIRGEENNLDMTESSADGIAPSFADELKAILAEEEVKESIKDAIIGYGVMPSEMEARYLSEYIGNRAIAPTVIRLTDVKAAKSSRAAEFKKAVVLTDDIDRLFAIAERATEIEAQIPDSEWAIVPFEKSHILVGRIEKKAMCYGVPASYSEMPPSGLEGAQWLPSKNTDPLGNGYWVLFE